MLHTHSFSYHPRCIMFLSHFFSFPLSVSFHQYSDTKSCLNNATAPLLTRSRTTKYSSSHHLSFCNSHRFVYFSNLLLRKGQSNSFTVMHFRSVFPLIHVNISPKIHAFSSLLFSTLPFSSVGFFSICQFFKGFQSTQIK